jgi:hypothetical protein
MYVRLVYFSCFGMFGPRKNLATLRLCRTKLSKECKQLGSRIDNYVSIVDLPTLFYLQLQYVNNNWLKK